MVGAPIAPSGAFAKGERIRGFSQIRAGEDLIRPTQVKVGYGELVGNVCRDEAAARAAILERVAPWALGEAGGS